MQSQDGFMLVDWVNGGRSDPYFDLATFALMHNLNEAQTNVFFTQHLMRTPAQVEWDHLSILKPVRPLVIAAAFLRNDTDSPSTPESDLPDLNDFTREHATGKINWSYRKIALVMLKHALHLSAQNECQNALRRLQKP
jgi:thiamine kinase-like enzyme